MRIAIIGIRGIPVVYSGFETFAEELSIRMVERGHRATVYGRKQFVHGKKKKYKGVDLVVLPGWGGKNFETIIHSFLATWHAVIFSKYDLIYYLGVGSAIYSWIPRIFGVKTVVNVDGLDWKREKWGVVAKKYLLISEKLAIWFSNQVVTDSEYIQNYYIKRYKYMAPYIPYGYMGLNKNKKSTGILKKHGLKKNNYYVWVGRLVPDNHLDFLIEAYKDVKTNKKCVVVGDNVSDGGYKKRMKSLAKRDDRVIFVGFQNRKNYQELVRNAFGYVETKKSGGTHPSLVEAMGFGSLIVANDHGANRRVLGDNCVYFKEGVGENDLRKVLNRVEKLGVDKIGVYQRNIKARAIKNYSWDRIVSKYEKLFNGLI